MKTLKLILGLTSFVMLSPSAYAGSFQINENSAVDLGRANSGRVTQTDDASAAYSNPALMTQFKQFTLTNSISYIDGKGSFEDAGSVDLLGQPLGAEPEDFFKNAFVPALNLVYPMNERLALGLSVNAPYGLASTYEPTSIQRYQALESALLTINVNPSFGYALSESLSIGGGINIQYAHAELSSAIDFGSVCFAGLGPANCGALRLTPQSADGALELEGDDISFGYNIGVAFTPHDSLKLGAHYRSEVKHRLEGDADLTVPSQAQILTTSGAFIDTQWAADLPLPGVFDLGVEWQAHEQFMISANFNRTDWSQLQTLDVEFENPAQPPTGEELRYNDSDRYSVGLDYAATPNWTLRTGLAFDETPQRDNLPTARIPDGDRTTYAIGATYKGWHFAELSLAYNYLSFDEAQFDKLGPTNDRVRGTSDVKVNIFAVGVMLEIKTRAAFEAWLKNEAKPSAAVQALDLCDYVETLKGKDFCGSIFLSCTMCKDATYTIVQNHGIVVPDSHKLAFPSHRSEKSWRSWAGTGWNDQIPSIQK